MNCWFCEKEEAVENKGYKVKMFGDVNKNVDEAGEAISFNRKAVTVPRCGSCKTKQRQAKILNFFAGFFLLGAGLLGVFEVFNVIDIINPWLRGMAFGVVVMLAIGIFLRKLLLMKGTKTTKHAKRNYPEIKQLLKTGYEFGDAPKQKSEPKNVVEEVEEVEMTD